MSALPSDGQGPSLVFKGQSHLAHASEAAALASEASIQAGNGRFEQSIPSANGDTGSDQQVLEMLRAALAVALSDRDR